tara:strand:- start:3635 stop:3820 length:186 start_codon:yes stop_codon:yes gene_type:complete
LEIILENKKVTKIEPLSFYSNDMTVAKNQLAHNQLKLTFQRNSIMDLDQKHKAWAQDGKES